jgi:hypothetical protein
MKPGNQVRLIIDDDAPNGLIGGADFGTAVTDHTIALSDDVRKLLRKYGHTKALLVLDAGEVLDRSADPPSSPSAA